MVNEKKPRAVALGIVKHGDKILVGKGYDKKKDEHFYRPIGGGIEFLEKAEDTLKREFQEEIGKEVKALKFLGVTENIFNYEGNNGHEIILLYSGEIADKDYEEVYHVVDGNKPFDAVWVDQNEFINKNKILYPEKVVEFLK